MYLHIIRYDRKFLADVHRHFENAAPGQNVYVAFGHSRKEARNLFPFLTGFALNAAELRKLISSHAQSLRGILTHGLLRDALPLLNSLPKLPVAWYVWGTEFYNEWPRASSRLYMQSTADLVNRLRPRWRHLAKRCILAFLGRNRQLAAASNRVDVCVSFSLSEFELIRRSGLLRQAVFRRDSVRSLEDIVSLRAAPVSGRHIQLGNSSCPNNNHIEMLQDLSLIALGDRKVFCPLSYGDPEYAEEVCRYGERFLGRNFHPVRDFIPLEEYASLLDECGFVIMNHLRQQAVGNIIGGLWRGAVVFLNETSVYDELRKQGVHVRRVTTIRENLSNAFLGLQDSEIVANRKTLISHYGAAALANQTNSVLDCLASIENYYAGSQ